MEKEKGQGRPGCASPVAAETGAGGAGKHRKKVEIKITRLYARFCAASGKQKPAGSSAAHRGAVPVRRMMKTGAGDRT
ncbi:MAG: hypothetical protein GX036_05770 [Firmicutes bacterium]|nr:hypothetical protein [Bacillota bacterium]